MEVVIDRQYVSFVQVMFRFSRRQVGLDLAECAMFTLTFLRTKNTFRPITFVKESSHIYDDDDMELMKINRLGSFSDPYAASH